MKKFYSAPELEFLAFMPNASIGNEDEAYDPSNPMDDGELDWT